MNTINERFNILLEALGKNPNSFAKSIGKTFTAIDSICKGRSKPGYELLEALFINYPQISRDWLLMGEGDMFKAAHSTTQKDSEQDYLREYMKRLEENFTKLSDQLSVKDRQIEGLQEMLKLTLGKFEGVHQSQTGTKVRKHPYSKEVRVSAVKEEQAA